MFWGITIMATPHMSPRPSKRPWRLAPAGRPCRGMSALRYFLKAADLLAGPYRAKINAATMLAQSKNIYQAEIDAACEFIDFLRFNAYFLQEIQAVQPESAEGIWKSNGIPGTERDLCLRSRLSTSRRSQAIFARLLHSWATPSSGSPQIRRFSAPT